MHRITVSKFKYLWYILTFVYRVPANSMAKVNFKMTPTFYGKQTIVAKFNSSNLNNVDGYLTVVVDEGNMNRNDVNTIN